MGVGGDILNEGVDKELRLFRWGKVVIETSMD